MHVRYRDGELGILRKRRNRQVIAFSPTRSKEYDPDARPPARITDSSGTNASPDYAAFFAWFHQQEDIENEAVRDDPRAIDRDLESVRRAIAIALPEIERLRFRRRKDGTSTFKVRKHDAELPFNALSDGERAMLLMVGDIARRIIHFDKNTPFVLLIDEVEAHLHPQWQHRVLPDLQRVFPNAQIIATTHSPIVAGSVPSRCLRVLRDFALVPVDHTEGRNANDLLEEVFGVPSRRQEVQDRLDALGDLIDDGAFGTAETELGELTAMLGPNDTELAYYRGLLHGRKASA